MLRLKISDNLESLIIEIRILEMRSKPLDTFKHLAAASLLRGKNWKKMVTRNSSLK